MKSAALSTKNGICLAIIPTPNLISTKIQVFIQGCDIFKVEVYANDNYKYEVEAGPLTSEKRFFTTPYAQWLTVCNVLVALSSLMRMEDL